jgi:RNA polymerase sigma-70 factor (ECF subfamily)
MSMEDARDPTELFSRCATDAERKDLLSRLFDSGRDRLRRMVALRLDPRLQRRLDPSDVIQEAYVEAAARLDEYLRATPMPVYLWLRRITAQKLADLQRRHLGAKARDVRKEVHALESPIPEASSITLAAQLVAQGLSPSEEALRREAEDRVRAALEEMDPIDREVIALRHFEELSNVEVSRVLGIEPAAASKRHSAALRRLGKVLKGPFGRCS